LRAKELPGWATLLECAAEWGMPPWELLDKPGYVLWSIRRNEYRAALAKHESLAYKK